MGKRGEDSLLNREMLDDEDDEEEDEDEDGGGVASLFVVVVELNRSGGSVFTGVFDDS